MASTSKTSSTKARTFDILLPRLGRAGEGAVFEAGSYVRRQGQVPAMLSAVRLSGSPLGTHAAPKDGGTSLCGLPITANGKSKAEVQATGTAGKVAAKVTCRFCEARLVGAGVKPASQAGAYAADYGTRDVEEELQAIAARAAKASKASKASK